MNNSQNVSIQDLTEKALSESKIFSKASIKDISPLAGDASGRMFFSVRLENSRPEKLILLMHGQTKGPMLTGGEGKTQEQAMAELAPFLKQHGVPVPELYIHVPEAHALFFEDVGDLPLWRFPKLDLRKDGEETAEKIGEDFVYKLFCRAIDIINLYQSIPPEKNCIAFQRGLAFKDYRREIAEFSDFYAPLKGIRPSEKEVLNKVYDGICETIMSFPRALVHFDFNAWNLFVDSEGSLKVIDFQDASLASPARDLLSLMNDRGMDETLGKSMQGRLARYYMEKIKPGPLFPVIYDMTLLHWDFRVSGRYVKLNQTFKTDRYEQWLPGTLRRLGRTLLRTYRSIHGLSDAMEIVMRLSPEVKEGVEDPWEIDWSQP